MAIVDFSHYIEKMDKNVRKRLMDTLIPDKYSKPPQTFKSVWDLLTRGFKANAEDEWTSSVYCVDMIATKIRNLLRENPSLYDLSPFNDQGPARMQSLAEEVKQSMQAVEASLPLIVGQPPCVEGNIRLCERFLPFLLRDLSLLRDTRGFILESMDLKCLMECYTGENPWLRDHASSILVQFALQRNPDQEQRLRWLTVEERNAFDRLVPKPAGVSRSTMFRAPSKRGLASDDEKPFRDSKRPKTAPPSHFRPN